MVHYRVGCFGSFSLCILHDIHHGIRRTLRWVTPIVQPNLTLCYGVMISVSSHSCQSHSNSQYLLPSTDLGVILAKQLRTFKVEKEYLLSTKEKCADKVHKCFLRTNRLKKEKERIKNHKV